MRRWWPVAAVALVLWAGAAWAVGDQAYLGIFAETRVQQMAGMPKIELPPGMDLSKMPGAAAMFSMGKPTRGLEVRLWSPGIAPKEATAYLDVPEGLGQGKRLNLELYRPKPGQTEAESAGPGKIPDFTIKIYWGSSPTVKPGQPKVIKLADLTGASKAAMQQQAQRAQRESYFYKPDWTTGYWPTTKQPGKIGDSASLEGHYALTTSYTGAVALDNPKSVEFLAPLTLTSPDLSQRVPLDGAVQLAWKVVPGLLGQYAMIMGMEGKNTLILWSSSEVERGAMMGDWGYLQMAEVRQFVADTVFMKPDRTSATVPAGIFKNADMANLMMTGYGPGSAIAEGQPLPRLQTKTSLMVMLGGKGMPDMGDMGGD